MIKKLRIKFIITSITAIFLILASVAVFINVSNYANIEYSIKEAMARIIDRPIDDAHPNISETTISEETSAHIYYAPPDEGPEDGGPDGDNKDFVTEQYYVVAFNEDGTVNSSNFAHTFIVKKEEGIAFATELYNAKATYGRSGDYFYNLTQKDNLTYCIVIDAKLQMDGHRHTILNSSIGFSVIFAVGVILIFINAKITFKSTEDSYKKQKEFITNASHELKTPITVVSADLDVLEMDGVKNEWTESIRNELKKLTKMTNELVILSRLSEENKNNYPFTNVNLSKELHDALDSFSSSFLTKKLKMKEEIEKEIIIESNPKLINELFSIFLENANKYALDEGELIVSLKRNDKKRVELIFANDIEKNNQINVNSIFDRFYRSPNAKKEGSGIGLAIAKEIVLLHKGSIKATIENDKIKFIIIF